MTPVQALPEMELITAEMFAEMPDDGSSELVEGKVVRMPPPKLEHGIVVANIALALGIFVRKHRLGFVAGESGVLTRRSPDSVRGPDVTFISHQRAAGRKPRCYLEIAPELVVEVLSESNTAPEMRKKLNEYFTMGINVVWIVDPEQRKVAVHRSLSDVRQFEGDAEVPGDDVLPEFSLPLPEIFAGIDAGVESSQ